MDCPAWPGKTIGSSKPIFGDRAAGGKAPSPAGVASVVGATLKVEAPATAGSDLAWCRCTAERMTPRARGRGGAGSGAGAGAGAGRGLRGRRGRGRGAGAGAGAGVERTSYRILRPSLAIPAGPPGSGPSNRRSRANRRRGTRHLRRRRRPDTPRLERTHSAVGAATEGGGAVLVRRSALCSARDHRGARARGTGVTKRGCEWTDGIGMARGRAVRRKNHRGQ